MKTPMNRQMSHPFASAGFSLVLVAVTVLLMVANVAAQCNATEVIAGLRTPLGITQSELGNLLVAETGTAVAHTGRISIVGRNGNRRTLLDGLPSAINDVGEPSGPARLFLRGRTLYVTIGVGDVGRPGPASGTTIPNPNPVSSPLFSSILAIHFSADVEKVTSGFALSLADQQALATGQKVTLTNGAGDKISIVLVTNFPNFVPFPLPFFADNVQLSNPFGLVAVGEQLYVTDGGRNLLWRVDIPTGSFSSLAEFPNIPNPLFPAVGPPTSDAVPTGVMTFGDQLLVALFRGAPFAPGTSVLEQVDPSTGAQSAFISGLKTAIEVLPIKENANDTDFLVLQHASAGPFFGSPGLVLRFETPAGSPVVVSNCLTRPTSMVLDRKTRTLFVSELAGRILSIPLP
jgi:hypothetical protein